MLAETFESPYLADVRLRFGLTEAADKTRLVILEQHPQTRMPWCQATLPFIAGGDVSSTWRALVESIWGHPPITVDADASELFAWVDSQLPANAVVLSLTPSGLPGRNPWPPVTEGPRRGMDWREVHSRAQMHPFRTVDLQQLSLLVRSRGFKETDVFRPSMARYVLLDPKKRTVQVIRESDPPGRFASLLKRSKSSLVHH